MSRPGDYTVYQATDPGTAAETLSAMAAQRPDLRQFVAANPTTPPTVLEWLGTLEDPGVRAALARRPGGRSSAPAPSATPEYGPPQGRAVASPPPPSPGTPSPGRTGDGPPSAAGSAASYGGPGLTAGSANPYTAGSADPYTAGTSDPYTAGPANPYTAGPANPYTAGPYTARGTSGGLVTGPAPGERSSPGGYGAPGADPAPGVPGADPYAAPGSSYADPAGPYGATGSYAPAGATGPYGAPPPWDAPEPRRRRTGVIVAAVIGGVVALLVLVGVALFALGSLGPRSYGDDADLDRLWDACEQGDGVACDDLYRDSPLGSEYEEFGDTCGYRFESGSVWCEQVL